MGVSELKYVGTCVRAQRIKIEEMRTHTRFSERTHTATNDKDCQNKSSIHYNKIKDMNASELGFSNYVELIDPTFRDAEGVD